MAYGNDGNLLQHAIEAYLASELNSGGDLYLLCTHAMAPFESLVARDKIELNRRQRFDWWWERALLRATGRDELPFLAAYRRCRQHQPDLYPNTAQILSELVGKHALGGHLCEVVKDHYDVLVEWCSGTDLVPHNKSWRDVLLKGTAPGLAGMPWLFTMDPFTFSTKDVDDGDLHPNDAELLAPPLRSLLQSPNNGAFTAFCYSMEPQVAESFRQWIISLARATGGDDAQHAFAEVLRGAGPKTHVCGMISRDAGLLERAVMHWESIVEATDGEAPKKS